jgi:hypothetical protein
MHVSSKITVRKAAKKTGRGAAPKTTATGNVRKAVAKKFVAKKAVAKKAIAKKGAPRKSAAKKMAPPAPRVVGIGDLSRRQIRYAVEVALRGKTFEA